MPKRAVETSTVSFVDADFAKAQEIRDRMREADGGTKEADDPDDDFDGRRELLKIVAKNAEVLKLGIKYDDAKEYAKKAKEVWEVASQELQDMIVKLGREYPLFERKQ